MAGPHRGGGGQPQNRRHPMGIDDRGLAAPGIYQGHQPMTAHGIQFYHQQRQQVPNPSFHSSANPETVAPHFSFLYPNGVPDNYKMVNPDDGSIPTTYTDDHFDVSFYTNPAKEVKAIFSTNAGMIPSRPAPRQATSGRVVHLWNAEEIQIRANSVRKKHWTLMKHMQKPEVWEDLYDYFDCFDIYFQGALNLWNLIYHLYHENQSLLQNLANRLAFEVGIWCDDWLAKGNNMRKLQEFDDWANILALFDPAEVIELRGMEPFDMEILRDSLRHRQSQLAGHPDAQPLVYPCNSLEYQWYHNTVQLWLAGLRVPDTPSGLDPVNTVMPLANISDTPPRSGHASQPPLVVSGTRMPSTPSAQLAKATPYQDQIFGNRDNAFRRGPALNDRLQQIPENIPQLPANYASLSTQSDAPLVGDAARGGLPEYTLPPSMGPSPQHFHTTHTTRPDEATLTFAGSVPSSSVVAQQQHRRPPPELGAASHRPRKDSERWEEVHDSVSIHGPLFRRSPSKDNRPRSFSRASSKTTEVHCQNQNFPDGDKLTYNSCDCTSCSQRERCVYVKVAAPQTLTADAIRGKLKSVMSRWGQVEQINWIDPKPSHRSTQPAAWLQAFVRYHIGTRVIDIARIHDFEDQETNLRLRISAAHHTKYGAEMYQDRPHRRGSVTQASLEQYMSPRPPLGQHPIRQSSVPAIAKPTAEKIIRIAAEAEAQSKPPSEEVLPDEDSSEVGSPRSVTSAGSCGKNVTIKVNLPSTPVKENTKKAEESVEETKEPMTPRNKVTLTPRQHAPFVTPTKTPAPERSTPSPTYGKGKYRRVFTQEEGERFDMYEGCPKDSSLANSRPEPAAAFPSSSRQPLTVLFNDGGDFDSTVDEALLSQSQNQNTIQSEASCVHTNPTEFVKGDVSKGTIKKKNKNKNKKKKKPSSTVINQAIESGNIKPQTSHASGVAVSGDQRVMVLDPETEQTNESETIADLMAKGFKPLGFSEPQQLSDTDAPVEASNKKYRADAGGSLRVVKGRSKQLSALVLGAASPQTFDPALPSATSYVTAKERDSSDGSQGMVSTPATPPSDETSTEAFTPKSSSGSYNATPKSKLQLNPQAKEFDAPDVRTLPVRQMKFAPIPLKRPGQHQRRGSQSSSASSHTLAAGNYSPKTDRGGDDEEKTQEKTHESATDIAKEVTVEKTAPENVGPSLTEKEEQDTNQPGPGNNDEENSWKVQKTKRAFSRKSNQPRGKNQAQQHQGNQASKQNRASPKKQRMQGQSHPQPRSASSHEASKPGGQDKFSSQPATTGSVSSLPKSSVWAKQRAASTIAAGSASSNVAAGASANPAKGESSGPPRPIEDGGNK